MQNIPKSWLQAGLTSEEIDLLSTLYSPAPWMQDKIPAAIREKLAAHSERVRAALVEEYSSSPLWKARAAKDPNYWKDFSVGRYNL